MDQTVVIVSQVVEKFTRIYVDCRGKGFGIWYPGFYESFALFWLEGGGSQEQNYNKLATRDH